MLLLAILLSVQSSQAQIIEDFQSKTIPAAWMNLDLDGNTDANNRPMNWYILADLQTTMPGDTNWVAAASSWFRPFAQANNWLIPVQINVSDPTFEVR
jgi:hypothetical protein